MADSSLTRRDLRDRIQEVLKENNLDPFVEAVNMIKDDDVSEQTKARLLSEIMKYIAPQLKAVDVDAKVAGSIKVVVDTFQEVPVQASHRTLNIEVAAPAVAVQNQHVEEEESETKAEE